MLARLLLLSHGAPPGPCALLQQRHAVHVCVGRPPPSCCPRPRPSAYAHRDARRPFFRQSASQSEVSRPSRRGRLRRGDLFTTARRALTRLAPATLFSAPIRFSYLRRDPCATVVSTYASQPLRRPAALLGPGGTRWDLGPRSHLQVPPARSTTLYTYPPSSKRPIDEAAPPRRRAGPHAPARRLRVPPVYTTTTTII